MSTIHYIAIKYISHINHAVDELFREALEAAGATGLVKSHGSILGLLYVHGKLNMYDLAQSIGRRKSTLTVLVDKLEAHGYVERTVCTKDSRVRFISLTAKGWEFQPVFLEISHKVNAKLWEGLSEAEMDSTMELLKKIANNLENAPDKDDFLRDSQAKISLAEINLLPSAQAAQKASPN